MNLTTLTPNTTPHTSITQADNRRIQVRGYDLNDLARHASYEEALHLLWFGTLPLPFELKRFHRQLIDSRRISKRMMDHLHELPRHATLLDALRSSVSILAHYDPDMSDSDASAVQRKSVRLVSEAGLILGALHRIHTNKALTSVKSSGSNASHLLHLLSHEWTPEDETLLTQCMILFSENGINPGTAALRHAAGTGADLHSAIVSALGASKGRAREIEMCRSLIHDIGSARNAIADIKTMLRAGKKIPGFGEWQDPRTESTLYLCSRHSKKKRQQETAHAIIEAMGSEAGLEPQAPFLIALMHEVSNIPPEISGALSALTALPGWSAHALEEYAGNHLPVGALVYAGPQPTEWVGMKKRR